MRVASAHMADAIREITVERGLDPRDGALMAFGGAGGLFATLLARESEVPTIVIPPFTGNFSAWGLLGADVTQTTAQTMLAPLSDESTGEAGKVLAQLLDELRERPGGGENGASAEAALDLRYQGQEYSLTVGVPVAEGTISADSGGIASAFEQEYEKIFGHRMQERIEIVAVRGTLRTSMRERVRPPEPGSGDRAAGTRMRVYSFTADDWLEFTLLERESLAVGSGLAGPALIAEETAMTYLDSGFEAKVHATGSLLIEPEEARMTERRGHDHDRGCAAQPPLGRRADAAGADADGLLADHLRRARLRGRDLRPRQAAALPGARPAQLPRHDGLLRRRRGRGRRRGGAGGRRHHPHQLPLRDRLAPGRHGGGLPRLPRRRGAGRLHRGQGPFPRHRGQGLLLLGHHRLLTRRAPSSRG